MASELTVDWPGRSEIDPLRLLEDSGALLYGDFKLSSGRRSPYYFDSKKLTLYPPGARLVASQMVRKLDAERIGYVGGVAYGGIPIVSHIVMLTGMRESMPIRAFYQRKDSKEHGTGASVEGQVPLGGEAVAMVEDVVTSGSSLLHSIRQAEEAGYNVTHTMAIVDRDEGGREAVEAAGFQFWSLFRVERSGGEVSFVYNGV